MLDSLRNKSKPQNCVRILAVGDVVGQPGLSMCAKWVPQIVKQCNVDGTVINGENSSKDGRGVTENSLQELLFAGADVVTTGNHVWRFSDFYPVLDSQTRVIRPANFPEGTPGNGYTLFKTSKLDVAVINLQGRIFMRENTSCPFKTAEKIVEMVRTKTKIILVDFHAEATSEKAALGFFLDGRVSAVFGTHTHVQTADHRVLPGGTAFVSDLGCCAALNSCLGIDKEIIVKQMQTQLPARFKVDKNPPFVLSGVIIDVDQNTGLAKDIQQVRIVDDFFL